MLMIGALSLEAMVLGVGTGLAAICTFGGGPMLSMTQLTTDHKKIHICGYSHMHRAHATTTIYCILYKFANYTA